MKKSCVSILDKDSVTRENVVFSGKECPMVHEEPVVLKLYPIYVHIIGDDYQASIFSKDSQVSPMCSKVVETLLCILALSAFVICQQFPIGHKFFESKYQACDFFIYSLIFERVSYALSTDI